MATFSQVLSALRQTLEEYGANRDTSPINEGTEPTVSFGYRLAPAVAGERTGEGASTLGGTPTEWRHVWPVIVSIPWAEDRAAEDMASAIDLANSLVAEIERSEYLRAHDAESAVAAYGVEVAGDYLEITLPVEITHWVDLSARID